MTTIHSSSRKCPYKVKTDAAAGDRTRVTRVTGGNTYHYTTTTRGMKLLATQSPEEFRPNSESQPQMLVCMSSTHFIDKIDALACQNQVTLKNISSHNRIRSHQVPSWAMCEVSNAPVYSANNPPPTLQSYAVLTHTSLTFSSDLPPPLLPTLLYASSSGKGNSSSHHLIKIPASSSSHILLRLHSPTCTDFPTREPF